MSNELEFLTHVDKIKSVWGKTAHLFVGNERTVSDLPTASLLVQKIVGEYSEGEWKQAINCQINASIFGEEKGFHQEISVSSSLARDRYNAGYTLCFSDLSDSFSSINELKVKALKLFQQEELLQVTGYLSPPSSTGVLHYDRQHNFFVQREGVKRWFVAARPAVVNPFENLVYPAASQNLFDNLASQGFEILPPSACGKLEFVLQPGDVLYVPPGFYHSPETLQEASLHFTLTIDPSSFWVEMNKTLLRELLRNSASLNMDERFLTQKELEAHREKCLTLIRDAIKSTASPENS